MATRDRSSTGRFAPLWFGALLSLLAVSVPPREAQAREARDDGFHVCGANPECRTYADNSNFFDLTQFRPWPPGLTCDATDYRRRMRRAPCPAGMGWVCMPERNVSVCLDIRLRSGSDGKPLGGQNRATCAAWCKSQGKRLPSNNEWLIGCIGTEAKNCLPANISHPIGSRLQSAAPWTVEGVNCKAGGAAWGKVCMNDMSLNANLPRERPRCLSQFGLRDMVGVLGQWVADDVKLPGRAPTGQFNGGLWPQSESSCGYTTVAHPADWSDYSIGCRCALDVPSVPVQAPPRPVRTPNTRR